MRFHRLSFKSSGMGPLGLAGAMWQRHITYASFTNHQELKQLVTSHQNWSIHSIANSRYTRNKTGHSRPFTNHQNSISPTMQRTRTDNLGKGFPDAGNCGEVLANGGNCGEGITDAVHCTEGTVVRYFPMLETLGRDPPMQWTLDRDFPMQGTVEWDYLYRGPGWGGGGGNSVFNTKFRAYSWFDKWNITIIQ